MAHDAYGLYRSTCTDGTPQFEIEYREGKLNGVMRRYAQNGQLILQCTYVDDVREGRCQRWFETGSPSEDAFYIDDKLEGEYLKYNEKGEIVMRARFKEGQILPDSLK